MKTESLRVGAKGTREAVKVPVLTAESLEDMQKLSRGSMPAVIRCFNRGFRIESQERSGAREAFRDGSPVEGIAKLVTDYDPSVTHTRATGPRKPTEVKLSKGKKSYTPEEFAALLASAGVKVNLVAAE